MAKDEYKRLAQACYDKIRLRLKATKGYKKAN